MTSYERATAGWDDAHERELAAAILATIIERSTVTGTGAPVVVVRTGEAASALLSALALVLTMSPTACRTREATRRMMGELGRRLRKRIANATADPGLQDFLRRCFHSNDVGGRA